VTTKVFAGIGIYIISFQHIKRTLTCIFIHKNLNF